MVDGTLAGEIGGAVDDLFSSQLTFTQELVRIPSQRGHELQAQDLMASAYRARGYDIDRFELQVEEIRDHPAFSPVEHPYRNAINVVATCRPREATGRSLILNGHMDVVPEGPHVQWRQPPYSGDIEGDWMCGRGVGDMKAGLVANLHALDALALLGYQPAAPVHLQSVIEEESTGNGTLGCLVRGYDAEAVLIPEPMGGKLIRSCMGVVWFRVRFAGTPAHAASMGSGFNAIDGVIRVIAALRELEAELNARKSQFPHFAEVVHPVNFNIGTIHGGDWPSSVPGWCDVECRMSCYPGLPVRDLVREIEDRVEAFASADPAMNRFPPSIEYIGHRSTGYTLEPGSKAEDVLRLCHAQAVGSELEEAVFPGYLDSIIYGLHGRRPTLVYGPVAENIHSFDERVNIPSIRQATKSIALFVAQWCGLERRTR